MQKEQAKTPKTSIKQPKKVDVIKESKYTSEEEEEVHEETTKKNYVKDLKKVFVAIIDPLKPLFTVKEDTPSFAKISADHLGLSITLAGRLKIRYRNHSGVIRNIYAPQWIGSNLPHDINSPKKYTLLDALIKRVTNVNETEQINETVKTLALTTLEKLKGDADGTVFSKICFVPLKNASGSSGGVKKNKKQKNSDVVMTEEKIKTIKDIIYGRYKDGFDLVLRELKELPDNINMGDAVEFVKGRVVSL